MSTTQTLLNDVQQGVPSGNYDGSSLDFASDAAAGPGYYQGNAGTQTVAVRVANFDGRIQLQGTLDCLPGDSTNWVSLAEFDTSDSAATYTEIVTVTGQFVWIRARVINFLDGTINSVTSTYAGAGADIGGGSDVTAGVFSSVTANAVYVGTTGIVSSGNITAPYFLGNGSQLTGITGLDSFSVSTLPAAGDGALVYNSANGVFQFTPADAGASDYGNANVVAYAESGWAGNIVPATDDQYSLGNATNQWSELWVSNSTIYIGGVPVAITGNVLTVNGEAVLQNDSASSITTTGNITANYFIGNGSQLTGLPESYGNANVATLLAAFGSNTVSTTGNVSAGNVQASSYRNSSGDPILGDYVFANNIIETNNGDGGIQLQIFGPDQADPPALINQSWLFGNTGAFYSPGNVVAPNFVGNGLFNGTTGIAIPTANSNIYVGFGNVGSIEFNAQGVNALNLAALGNITGVTANISGNITAGNVSVTGDITANNYVYFRGGSIIGDETDGNIFRVIAPLTYGVSIETDADIEGNNWNWTFNADGTLDTPGAVNVTGNLEANNLVVTNIAEIGDISIAGGYITLVDGSASTGIDISPNPEGQAFLQVPNDATANTANLRVVNNSGNVRIETNAGNIWTFGYDGDLSAPGNVSANAILTDNYLYANGAPFSSGANIGNLAVTGTTIGIAAGAGESTITVGNAASGLTVNPDSEVPVAKMYAYSTAQDFFSQGGGDYTSGTYTTGPAGGRITLSGATIVQDYLNASQYTIVSVTINGTDTVPYSSAGWGGGTVTIDVTTPPSVDPTTVTDIEFNTQFENRVVLDTDEVDYGIYIGDHNFDIQSVRDVRITSGDDFSIESEDGFDLRSRSTTGGIDLITDYGNSQQTWQFLYDGTLTTPGDITVAGDITGTASASTLVLAAEPNSNTAIQLNDSVDSIIRTVANLEIRTDSSNTDQTWTFDTAGNLTAPGHITTTGNISAGNIILTDSFTVPSNFEIAADSSVLVEFNDGASNTSTFFAQFGEIYLNVLEDSATTDFRMSSSNVTISDGSGGASELIVIGNVSAGNFVVSESLFGSDASPQPTISGFSTISATGNITGGNLITTGNITAGNILTDNYRYANGDPFVSSDYGDSNVVTLLSAFGSNTISTTGNITAANFIGNVSLTGNITGSSSNVELVANAYVWTFDNTGNTAFANGTVTANDITLTGNISANIAGYAIGYRDIPQVSFTGNATIATTDAGKHYYSTESTDYILTIANNASQGFQVGAAISIVNQGTGNITVAQGSGVSLYLAGNATTGNRTISTFGMATLMKVDTDTWFINGTGVS